MKVGFIGLGVMGFQMAGHLQASQHDLRVFNRSEEKSIKWKSWLPFLVSQSFSSTARLRICLMKRSARQTRQTPKKPMIKSSIFHYPILRS